MCAGWRERGRQRGWSRSDWADTEGSRWGWRTMLGSDDTRRTAENCRRTLLFAMRRLNGHTSTARMRTSARSATAAQNGPKCQLGSAASIAAIRAVAGSREDSGSAVGPNRSGYKELSVMDTERAKHRANFGFRAAKLASLCALPLSPVACSCWQPRSRGPPALAPSCFLSVIQQQR
eukprot:scaffold28018_cov70-Phaeocystis_antarctica.AAC.6